MVVEEFITRNGSPEMMCLLKSLLPGYPCNRLSAEEGLSKMAGLGLEKPCLVNMRSHLWSNTLVSSY